MSQQCPVPATPPQRRADGSVFREISYVTGDVSRDGSTIQLKIETVQDGQVQLSFPTIDLQHVVTLLLMLGGKAATRGKFAAVSETYQPEALPLHGASIGIEENGEGVLTVELGATVLSFSMPRSSMEEIGRTMMTMSAPEERG